MAQLHERYALAKKTKEKWDVLNQLSCIFLMTFTEFSEIIEFINNLFVKSIFELATSCFRHRVRHS